MTKQILPNELAEIVTGLLIKPELLGELDSREAHQAFMLDIGRVIADHCGGRVNGITDGDVAKPYLSDIECTPTLHIEPDDRLPSTERNVWSNYHVEAWADEGQETILDRAIRNSDRGARRIRKKSYAKVFRASVRAETSRLPVCGSAARRNRRLG